MERQGEEAMEDIGYRYLTELAERYMIVVAKRDAIGRIKRCQLHDLMRELSLSKSQEENFSKVVPLNGIQTKSLNISSSSVMVTGRIRRLSLHLNRFPGDVALECEEYPPFKSLLGFSLDQQSGLSQTLTATLVHCLKLLRTLDLQCVKLLKHDIVPRKTTKLTPPPTTHLKTSLLNRQLDLLVDLKNRFSPSRVPTECVLEVDKIEAPLSSSSDRKENRKATVCRRLKIVAYDDVLLQRFQKIFTPPTTFDNLHDLSISTYSIDDTSIPTHSIDDNTRDNIKSCCPRLLLLKSNGKVVYQKTADVSALRNTSYHQKLTQRGVSNKVCFSVDNVRNTAPASCKQQQLFVFKAFMFHTLVR
ncbi:hypothetical protein V6N13_078928 [Hibiscus sabdariffa]|uniref:Disease resistance protein winged helix domain-containing protein n=1 Tax=Hibiscus sabdariffa TaxID=183260 RepID=A0ABR2RQQ3_9ROSI